MTSDTLFSVSNTKWKRELMDSTQDTKLFLDTANLDEISLYRSNPLVSGFTTNPTLMRSAGIENYLNFAQKIIELVRPLPLSLEVFADDEEKIYRQAKVLSNMYENLYVKIPVTTTQGI